MDCPRDRVRLSTWSSRERTADSTWAGRSLCGVSRQPTEGLERTVARRASPMRSRLVMGTLAERPTCTLPRQTVRPGVTALQEETVVRPLSFAQERIAHRLGLPT